MFPWNNSHYDHSCQNKLIRTSSLEMSWHIFPIGFQIDSSGMHIMLRLVQILSTLLICKASLTTVLPTLDPLLSINSVPFKFSSSRDSITFRNRFGTLKLSSKMDVSLL